MFAQILPNITDKEKDLISCAVSQQADIAKLGFSVEYIPGKGVNIHVLSDSPKSKLPYSELRILLIACGVKILKAADIQGSVQVLDQKYSDAFMLFSSNY